MKKIALITICIATIGLLVSCNKVRRSPGRAYMPDMTYSVAYETYSNAKDRLKKYGANYTALPVEGTFAKGDMTWVYPYKNDSMGYVQSASVTNPLNIDSVDMVESERLYLVNCGICHGTKLDGNGPLYKGGDGPYPSKPATLVGDPKYAAMTEGTMFHSVTYGKNAMGSYASQLSTKQRWMVIHYIKSKQGSITNAPDAMAVDTTK